MRSFAVSIALTIVIAAAAAVLVAQQPAAPAAPPEMKTYVSAADVQALIANAKGARLLGAAPYSVNMEYRAPSVQRPYTSAKPRFSTLWREPGHWSPAANSPAKLAQTPRTSPAKALREA